MIDGSHQVRVPFSRPDTAAALGDFLALRAGIRLEAPDPIAEELALRERDVALADIAAHLAGRQGLEGHELTREIHTTDFGWTLANGLQQVLAQGYRAAVAPIDALVVDLPTRNYQPQEVGLVDLGDLAQLPDSGVLAQPTIALSTGGTVRPIRFGATFVVGRRLAVDDPSGTAMTRAIMQFGQSAARVEMKLLAAALDAASLSTDAVSGGISVGNLDDAVDTLAGRTVAGGDVSGLPAAAIVVHPSKEITLRTVLTAAGVGWRIVSNPWLTTSTALAYVVASPTVSPCIVRTRLSDAPTITPRPVPVDYDGSGYLVTFDTGVEVVSTAGIVRITS